MIFVRACVRACMRVSRLQTERQEGHNGRHPSPLLSSSLLPFALVTRNSLFAFSIFAHSCLFTSAKQPSSSFSLSWLLHLFSCPFSFLQRLSQIVIYMTNGRALCQKCGIACIASIACTLDHRRRIRRSSRMPSQTEFCSRQG